MPEDHSQIDNVVFRSESDRCAPMTKELHMTIIGGILFLTLMEEQDASWADGKCTQSFKELESFQVNLRVFKAGLEALEVCP